MRFRAIQMEKANFPISMMCDALGVSRSGFAAFDTRPMSAHARTDAKLAVAKYKEAEKIIFSHVAIYLLRSRYRNVIL